MSNDPAETTAASPLSSSTGDITVDEAVEHIRDGAVLVDVRSAAEWQLVGVPITDGIGNPVVFVEWADSHGTRNPGFLEEIAPLEGQEILFLCRSGRRSAAAAEYARAAGHTTYNILHGFETAGGWQDRRLAWKRTE